jgi:hypothetical protein
MFFALIMGKDNRKRETRKAFFILFYCLGSLPTPGRLA